MTINKTAITSIYNAAALLDDIAICYNQAKQMQSKLALYQAGTDPNFNAAINAIISPGDRARIAAMLTQSNALITAWEASYSDIITPT
jgi:hypothetical protein